MYWLGDDCYRQDSDGCARLETALQLKLQSVKRRIFEARTALEDTKVRKWLTTNLETGEGRYTDSHYADRNLAVAEQHLNLALLALAEGREQMRNTE